MALRKLLIECTFLILTALAVICVFEVTGTARTAAALLLVFVLPGRAFLAAWYPQRLAEAPGNILLTFVMSIAIAVIGGLLLNLLPQGLNSMTWAIWLGIVSLFCQAVALVRTPNRGRYVQVYENESLGFRPLHVLSLLLACVIVFGAFMVARNGVYTQQQPGFTQFWMLPGQTPDTMQVGVQNQEGAPMTYWLVIQQGTTPIYTNNDIQVDASGAWNTVIQLPVRVINTQQPIEAQLYRGDQLSTVYRDVHLWLSDTSSK